MNAAHLTYDLKHPFDYAKDTQSGNVKTCIAIEFRRPKGSEATKTFKLLSALKPLADGGVPDDLADTVLTFINTFAEPIGTEIPMSELSQNIDGADLLAIAGECIENFT